MSDLTFLVVEDSPTMRQLISFSLKRIRNARIIEAANGVEALKRLSEESCHLIVADINMPLMDGLKLLEIVRQEPRYAKIPVVICTTEGAEADRQKGLKLGANAYLSKPVQVNELLKIVRELLSLQD
jgi:two-component system chemotaxis response regulator CheY